ncbi:MAG: alpha/beta hydrolase [Gemmatimonadota bacterium]|nr:alpha/beta hydrolase [Gemmatimonadota bacterium]
MRVRIPLPGAISVLAAIALLALSVLPEPAAAQQPDSSDAGAGQEVMLADQFFDADGVGIRYVDVGEGDPVILLHGFALDVEMNWASTGLLESLPGEFRLIALDLRGHGRSDKPGESDGYGPEFVNDVLRLMDHVGIAQAYVVGYSMGGRIALKLVTEHPDRVRAAVLGGSGWAPPGTPPPAEIRGWIPGLQAVVEGEGSVTEVLWQPGWPEPPLEWRAALDANDAGALAAVLLSLEGLSVAEAALRDSPVPILAVVGEDDFARPDVDALAAVRPDVTVVLLPGSNHATALVDPGLEQAVLSFLRAQR